jgi:hypothetical protein
MREKRGGGTGDGWWWRGEGNYVGVFRDEDERIGSGGVVNTRVERKTRNRGGRGAERTRGRGGGGGRTHGATEKKVDQVFVSTSYFLGDGDIDLEQLQQSSYICPKT